MGEKKTYELFAHACGKKVKSFIFEATAESARQLVDILNLVQWPPSISIAIGDPVADVKEPVEVDVMVQEVQSESEAMLDFFKGIK